MSGGGKFNWARVEHERKLAYSPSPRVQAPTNRQLKFIGALAREKGQPLPKPPLTKHGASELIERLLALPDSDQPMILAPEPEDTAPINLNQEMVIELRQTFPQLSPMGANSLINLFTVIDPQGSAFILDGIIREDAPEDPDQLMLHLVKRFLQDFGALNTDDALVSG